MEGWSKQISALVDGALPDLPELPESLRVAEPRQFDVFPAPKSMIVAHLLQSKPRIASGSNAMKAGDLLVQHIERTYEDRQTQFNILKGLQEVLAEDVQERVAEGLTEYLGFEQLDLASTVVANKASAQEAIAHAIARRAAGVGSSADPLELRASVEQEQYPNVFASGEQNNVVTAGGSRFALPIGTTRVHESYYEEVTVPPSKPLPFRATERLVPLEEMDVLCRGAFRNYKSLNRLQSAVYPVAYKSNENMLVCAPTGAGKTDVAMLSVLRCISRFCQIEGDAVKVDRDAFKIVYVAPMKALVSEIVAKFSKRLQYLGIRVRELTGDMQLTRREIAETQMIVTTPEKWDVVTRRPTGDGELALMVRLLIIDEVHLLHEDRGAVIETIVARTQRLVESTQSMIRIVGLSATLPNYVDVADFLGVNRWRGLFYFGSSFRPVPLEQHFVGVRGKNGSALARTNLDRVVYEKVLELAEQRHPVMVFVHTRKSTVQTAEALLELGKEDGLSNLLTEDREDTRFDKEIAQSRNRELRELFAHGIGIHHAGMLRSDRDLAERTFAAGATRVLCCTATLAWGVNLPAYAVIIKGTDVYNAEVGKFVDLGILDVLQIFGRAGRPQYEDVGVGYICTSGEKVPHYIEAITSSHPIESRFLSGIVDALNAEVALGSVSSISDGVSWLGFTYLYTRLNKAPLVYGIDFADLAADPSLTTRREHWISSAARILVEHGMAVLDSQGGLHATTIGRIASRYYLQYKTVGVFQEKLRNNLREADALDLMSRATDFGQIAMRDSEEQELESLLDRVPCEVSGGAKTQQGKVNILLQAHISNAYVDDFALVSDMRYIAQNAGRILLSLFDLSLDRGYATAAFAFLNLAKAVEHRIWPFEHPLRQVTSLSPDILHKVAQYADELEVAQICAMQLTDLASLLHANERIAKLVQDAAKHFPELRLVVNVRPRPDGYVRLEIELYYAFEWSDKMHGNSIPVIVYVEDNAQRVVSSEQIVLRKPLEGSHEHTRPDYILEVDVPCDAPAERAASQAIYHVTWTSSHWLGADGSVEVSLEDVWPPKASPSTQLLDLPLLSVESCLPTGIAASYARNDIIAYNAMQTQVFHTLFHTCSNVLLCGPIASGKLTVLEAAIWRARSALVLVPDSVCAKKVISALRAHGPRELSIGKSQESDIRIVTPEDFPLSVSSAPTLALFVDLHRLSNKYELNIMQVLRLRPERIVATSACLATASSLSAWLNIKQNHTYTFQLGDHPYPATLAFETVDVNYSDALVRAFIKPAYDHIRNSNPEPAILIAASRTQCMLAARELLARLATDTSLMLLADPESIASRAQNTELAYLLRQGLSVWHHGLSVADRRLVEELYDAGIVRVLLCPREVIYELPMRAHLCLVLGTQYMKRSHDDHRSQVVEYSIPDLMQMHALAVRPRSSNGGKCVILCQQSRSATLARHLRSPYVVESGLHLGTDVLQAFCNEIQCKRIRTRDDAIQWLSASFLRHRMAANPVYYDIVCDRQQASNAQVAAGLSRVIDRIVSYGHALRILRDGKQFSIMALGKDAKTIRGLCHLQEYVQSWHVLPDEVIKRLSQARHDVSINIETEKSMLEKCIPSSTLAIIRSKNEEEQGVRFLLASWLADAQNAQADTLARSGLSRLTASREALLLRLVG
ncbi:RNA helicase [Malassezia psittaci]|uniref:RNA helicase n=1 Tax=Malassezia psittaci TaxID=1821823 RepID=A0AAF0F8Y2_9BASI|nr:RNA helicase [Malassezia psittaci]